MPANKTEKRTQIYLTTAQHRAVMGLARGRNQSLAGVVRDAIDRYLRDEGDRGARWQGDPAFELIGAAALPARSRAEKLADDVDRVVYEEENAAWSSPTAPGSSPPSTVATRVTHKPPRRGGRSRGRGNGSSPRSSSSPRRSRT